ncbi:hypothetical protein [Vibrio neonatus]|uniref:hypothetical protein n=1 Tax=Vibrio neonatus TaxID=278860 RepID=UPI0021C4C705|nr:hypothetical protein [Vibrio neonatus]
MFFFVSLFITSVISLVSISIITKINDYQISTLEKYSMFGYVSILTSPSFDIIENIHSKLNVGLYASRQKEKLAIIVEGANGFSISPIIYYCNSDSQKIMMNANLFALLKNYKYVSFKAKGSNDKVNINMNNVIIYPNHRYGDSLNMMICNNSIRLVGSPVLLFKKEKGNYDLVNNINEFNRLHGYTPTRFYNLFELDSLKNKMYELVKEIRFIILLFVIVIVVALSSGMVYFINISSRDTIRILFSYGLSKSYFFGWLFLCSCCVFGLIPIFNFLIMSFTLQ